MSLFGRWHKGDALIDTLIVPPVQKYAGADETLAQQTKQRRAAADVMRRRAEAVATGAAPAKVLTLTRRKER